MTRTDALCLLIIGILAACGIYAATSCRQYTEGTDHYHQCMTGEEIDLSIQDEADSPISKGRD